MEKIILLFCSIGILLACRSGSQDERPSLKVSGFIFDEFVNAIENAEIKIIETTYSPNLTDNNNGFSKFIQKHGTSYSDSAGYFKMSVPDGDGIREILVSKLNFKPYRGVLNISNIDTMVLMSSKEILPNQEGHLSVEVK